MRMGMCHCGTGRSAERGARADGDSIRTGNRSRRPSLVVSAISPISFGHLCAPAPAPASARARLTKQTGQPEPRTGAETGRSSKTQNRGPAGGSGCAGTVTRAISNTFHTAGSSHSEAERLGLRYWYAYFAYAHISVWGAQKLSAFSSHPRDWGIRRTNQRSINRRFKSSAASCNRAHRFAWIHRL